MSFTSGDDNQDEQTLLNLISGSKKAEPESIKKSKKDTTKPENVSLDNDLTKFNTKSKQLINKQN